MSVAATPANDERLLTPIKRTLHRVIWRARLAVTLRGVLATLAAAVVGILLAMGVAVYAPSEDAWQDYALTALWVAAAGAAAQRTRAAASLASGAMPICRPDAVPPTRVPAQWVPCSSESRGWESTGSPIESNSAQLAMAFLGAA